MSQDHQIFVLNTHVEELNNRDLALAVIVKGFKKKTAKRNLDSFGGIKAWSGLPKSKDRIKRLIGQLELDDSLDKVIRIYQSQRSEKKGN